MPTQDGILELTRPLVNQLLPREHLFLVEPNQSYDGNERRADEETFPDDGEYVPGPWPEAPSLATTATFA